MTAPTVQTPNASQWFVWPSAEAEREALGEPTAPTPEPTEAAPEAAPSITATPAALSPEAFVAQTAVLRIGFRAPTFRKVMNTKEIIGETDKADPAMFAVAKRLLDSPAMKAIHSADNKLVEFIVSKASPCSLMGAGSHVIRLTLVNEVDAAIEAHGVQRAALIQTLLYGIAEGSSPPVTNYEAAKEQAKTRLKGHYREDQYPSADVLEKAFGVEARWLTFNVPAAFEAQNEAIYRREVAAITADLQDAGAEIRTTLRTSLADVVDTLAERLGSDPATGKPLVFRDSTVEKLLEFVDSVSQRDLTGDTDLMALASKARGLLTGVPVERLRTDGSARTAVLAGMTEIKAALRAMDVVPKRRKIRSAEEV